MPSRLFGFLFGNLRRQLVGGVTAAIVLLTFAFTAYLTFWQEQAIVERQTEYARDVARALGTSAAGWIASRDAAGLQELVDAQQRHKGLEFAMVTDPYGQVLAHTDRSHAGRYLLDLPARAQEVYFARGLRRVDVAEPVFLDQRPIGWVRLAIGERDAIAEVRKIRLSGLLFAFVATLLTTALAVWLGLRLTRRLRVLEAAMIRVEGGEYGTRIELPGTDEAAHLAAGFNRMQEALDQRSRERQEARTALEELNAALEQRVVERTRELAAAKEAAEAGSRAKSLFLANTSHELRTPLNAVLGFAQLMARDTRLAPEHLRYLETINRSGQHLLSLINDILEISRIESGKLELKAEAFAPTEMLESLVAMLQPEAQAKGLALKLEIAAALPPWVRTDPLKLKQILLNLLGNAVKYSDHGEVVLTAAAGTGPAGPYLEFAVTDTGVGLSAEELEHIYEPFYLAGHGVRRQGTGLGLPIASRYAEALGGSIAATSTPGAGSRFRVVIPVAPAQAPQAPPQAAQRTAAVASAVEVRILVVDDDEDQRLLTTRLLRDSSFTLREAASGPEALKIYGEWQPQLILLDMRMPGMDGLAVARRIRALPGGDKTVIIALTASAFEEERATFIAAGCDEVAIKPVELDKVLALLTHYLGIHTPAAPVAAPAAAPAPPPLRPEALAPAQRRQLREAAIRLDRDAVAALCADLDGSRPEAAAAIRALAENYRYDELARLAEDSSPP
ncbi:MAG: response regulator [Sterolibacteriaceae bacterium MAG5]|nr:response regulator [Candidatus Nitricoxidireducens bremensis]